MTFFDAPEYWALEGSGELVRNQEVVQIEAFKVQARIASSRDSHLRLRVGAIHNYPLSFQLHELIVGLVAISKGTPIHCFIWHGCQNTRTQGRNTLLLHYKYSEQMHACF